MLINLALAAVTALTLAGHSADASGRILDARWSLNPAGQLVVHYDPLHNGRSEFAETYTVILNDRAPKICGDPDGTGRHTWFFTDALMIEVTPVRSQPTPQYPSSPEGELAQRYR